MSKIDSVEVQDAVLFARNLVREAMEKALRQYYGTLMDIAGKMQESTMQSQTIGGAGSGASPAPILQQKGE